MNEGRLFLSPEWVHEVTRVVQSARGSDANFRKLTQGFSLSLLYVITELPQSLRELHNGAQLAILVQLDKGTVRKILLGTGTPEDKVNFTVSSSYSLAKRIFIGEMNPAVAFIDRQLKVDPLREVYRRPRFTARAITAGNALLKVARHVLTVFPQDDSVAEDDRLAGIATRERAEGL
ncbi:MAG: hypothetical protein HY669_04400 [Chloroflexi bacterium]|nr:hypothetical protein [Chloroflexota bacterium]